MSDEPGDLEQSDGGTFFDGHISGKDRYLSTLADDSRPPCALSPDSLETAGVQKGVLRRGHHIGTKVYPGVERDHQVYVPAQYDETMPAAVIVFQDGQDYLGPPSMRPRFLTI